MRKLAESEIQKIDDRLKSLQIRYTEVYEGIRDHYITALEQVIYIRYSFLLGSSI